MPDAATVRPLPLAGVSILVVEDDSDSLEALRQLLQLNGAEVQCAPSAGLARRAFAKYRPQFVISDLSMPGEDGFSFLASVRALPMEDGGTTPALAFSAMSPVNARARARGAGFQGFLRKPDDVPLIVSTVVGLLASASL